MLKKIKAKTWNFKKVETSKKLELQKKVEIQKIKIPKTCNKI